MRRGTQTVTCPKGTHWRSVARRPEPRGIANVVERSARGDLTRLGDVTPCHPAGYCGARCDALDCGFRRRRWSCELLSRFGVGWPSVGPQTPPSLPEGRTCPSRPGSRFSSSACQPKASNPIRGSLRMAKAGEISKLAPSSWHFEVAPRRVNSDRTVCAFGYKHPLHPSVTSAGEMFAPCSTAGANFFETFRRVRKASLTRESQADSHGTQAYTHCRIRSPCLGAKVLSSACSDSSRCGVLLHHECTRSSADSRVGGVSEIPMPCVVASF